MIRMITLGFVEANVFEYTMHHLYEEGFLSQKYEHHFLDQHYPVERENNVARLKAVCDKYGMIWHDSGFDRGLHKGFNHLMSIVKPSSEDILLGVDPDEYPITKGWDLALIDALENSALPYACLSNRHNVQTPNVKFSGHKLGNTTVLCPVNAPTMIGVTAWKWSFLEPLGGFHEPTKMYGHLESWLWGELQKQKLRYGIIPEYLTDNSTVPPHNPLYTLWKAEHASFISDYSFKEWLEKRNAL